MVGALSGTRFASGVAASAEAEHDMATNARTRASLRTPALPVCVHSSLATARRFKGASLGTRWVFCEV